MLSITATKFYSLIEYRAFCVSIMRISRISIDWSNWACFLYHLEAAVT
jgi:hypothetical protein